MYDIVAESFETSVPWDRCYTLCENVKKRIQLVEYFKTLKSLSIANFLLSFLLQYKQECHAKSIFYFSISCRVTQTYDAGACVYFYFAFNYKGFPNPVELFEHIENGARDEILNCGGSLSHHHGVGKIRSQYYTKTITQTGADLYKATKQQLDPKNIFATGNLLPADQQPQSPQQATSRVPSSTTTNTTVKAKL